MSTKKIILYFTLIAILSCKSQKTTIVTFETLRNELVNFMVKKKDIKVEDAENYKNGHYVFNLKGVNNKLSEGKLKDGIYSFATLNSHSRAYFVIVENNHFIILDISTRNGLDEAIKNTLDYCERNKYCVDITNDYIARLMRVFYKVNKNPSNGDTNCERGVIDTKELP